MKILPLAALGLAVMIGIAACYSTPFQAGYAAVTDEDTGWFLGQLITRMVSVKPNIQEGDVSLWTDDFGAIIHDAAKKPPAFWQGFAQKLLEQAPPGITFTTTPVFIPELVDHVPDHVMVHVRKVLPH